MADLNKAVTDSIHVWEDTGNNIVPNADFESAPTFVAATSTSARWINGAAIGSTTDDTHQWADLSIIGTASARFDTAEFHGGAMSMKLAVTATGSNIVVRLATSTTVANINKYYIPVLPSTVYKMTFWMKTTYTSGDSSDGCNVQILEYGSASTTVLQTTVSTKVKTTTAWTQYTMNFTTSSGTAFLTPNMQNIGTSGTATLIMDGWFDDFILLRVANQTPDLTIGPIVTPGVQNVSGPKIWS